MVDSLTMAFPDGQAARPTLGAPFGAPTAIPELAYPDRSTVDGFLTDDGLTFLFSSSLVAPTTVVSDGGLGPPDASAGGVSTSDLLVAYRRSTDEPFTVTQPLADLNTPSDERDPWLSPDGDLFCFTSDRDGVLSIYTATVAPR